MLSAQFYYYKMCHLEDSKVTACKMDDFCLPVSFPDEGTYLSEIQRSPKYWLLPSSTGARSFHSSIGPARSTEFSGSWYSPENESNILHNNSSKGKNGIKNVCNYFLLQYPVNYVICFSKFLKTIVRKNQVCEL